MCVCDLACAGARAQGPRASERDLVGVYRVGSDAYGLLCRHARARGRARAALRDRVRVSALLSARRARARRRCTRPARGRGISDTTKSKMIDDNRPPGREIRNAIYRMSMCRARVSRIGICIWYCIRCVRQLPASSLFLLAALGILFGSRSSWLLLGTLPRPPEVDEEALVVHLPAAEHGARHPSRRSEARARGGRCSVPARTRRVWRHRSSPAPRRRASGLPAPARAASRPSRSSGPPRLPSRRRAGAQGLGGKPAARSLAAGVAVHGRLHHSARSGITLT